MVFLEAQEVKVFEREGGNMQQTAVELGNRCSTRQCGTGFEKLKNDNQDDRCALASDAANRPSTAKTRQRNQHQRPVANSFENQKPE